ncbi:MAG: transporter substrate-binding domain-containing protein [Halioglobus sp.]|nr:transporter substrate-binding domain-containing protein [Halioglobus sp.]
MSGRIHTTIRIKVVTAFVFVTVLTAALAIGLQYYFGQVMAREVATRLYASTSASIAAELRGLGQINANVIDLLADNPALRDAHWESAHVSIFTEILLKNPLYHSVYLGRNDGSYFEVINLESSNAARRALRASPVDRWLIVSIQGGTRYFSYLDNNLKTRLSRSEATHFNVRSRPWFRSAMQSEDAQFTDPYIFAQADLPGRTVSKRLNGEDTVVAIDLTLATMSQFLRSHEAADQGDIYLYTGDGQIIASSLHEESDSKDIPVPDFVLTAEEKKFVRALPPLIVSNELNWPPYDFAVAGEPQGYAVDLLRLVATMTGLKLRFINGYNWPDLVEMYEAGEIDLLQPVFLTEQNQHLGLFGSSFAELPFALASLKDKDAFTDLAQMDKQRLAIPKGWSVLPVIRKRFPGIHVIEADSTLDALHMVLAGNADAAMDNGVILQHTAHNYFLPNLQLHHHVNVGAQPLPDDLHIVVPQHRQRLRALLDRAIAAIGSPQRSFLDAQWLSPTTSSADSVSSIVPSEALIQIAANSDGHGILKETEIDGTAYLAYAAPTGSADDAIFVGILSPQEAVVAPVLNQVSVSILGSAALLLLLLPASWLFANPIVRPVKQLARENDKIKRREYNKVERVQSEIQELDELSDSMVSMVDAIQAHEFAQRNLMDSFIELIAQAIDDKSAYTGGHCKRVPELAIMLAEHASASELPAFESFNLTTDDQWREYRIAAWLHDCGKITTPEHIVDKGSKLEVIYNRIHEIRMRFEVLWRDAEIEYLVQLHQWPQKQPELAQRRNKTQEALLEDFAFVATCNVGGESLNEDRLRRLEIIASKTWLRHFDDRLGLSPLEEMRIQSPPDMLPARERLLSNKPVHIIQREQSTDYPTELGIKMEVPEHLYNQGELYNLSVSRGTLTTEDRFKINEHMISTIKMLESLPFPEELKNVPRYASTHHETLKGTGYPRKLAGEELSIPERLLAVADVFEALTAADRPYKKAKTVSEALDILYTMVLNNHIDKDCFELFVRDKIYVKYAQEFLPEAQLDAIDESRYLSS